MLIILRLIEVVNRKRLHFDDKVTRQSVNYLVPSLLASHIHWQLKVIVALDMFLKFQSSTLTTGPKVLASKIWPGLVRNCSLQV